MYPSRHSSVPSLPNVVFTVEGPTQQLPGGQSGLTSPGYVHVPPASHSIALQAQGLRNISIPSQCYPATYLAARQPYGNGMIYGPASAAASPQTGVPYLKKRTVFPKHVTSKLRQWLKDNIENPFPDEEQKDQLCKDTRLTLVQLNYWFINARRRVWPGLKDEVNKERAKQNLPPIQLPLQRRGKDNELIDQDDTDGDMIMTDGDDLNTDELEGCINLQTVTAAQLKKVRKGSLSSSSDLSSSTAMTSSEDVSSTRQGVGYSGLEYQTYGRPPSVSSTSGDDQLLTSSADNVPELVGGDVRNGHSAIAAPRSMQQREQQRRQRSPPDRIAAGKDVYRMLHMQQRQHHLDSSRHGSLLMRSAPCIYRRSGGNPKEGDNQASPQHHYQSMPHIQPALVPASNTPYMPPAVPPSAPGSKEDLHIQPAAKPQYIAMIPAAGGAQAQTTNIAMVPAGASAAGLSAANQLQHLHLGPVPFTTPALTPQHHQQVQQQPHHPHQQQQVQQQPRHPHQQQQVQQQPHHPHQQQQLQQQPRHPHQHHVQQPIVFFLSPSQPGP